MPNFDKTGPQGQGKLTGRGMGSCGDGQARGFGRGRGFGGKCRGYGRGLGRYFGWNAPQTTEEKTEDLKAYKQALQEELEDIEKELASVQ